jgi:hypothetical protein
LAVLTDRRREIGRPERSASAVDILNLRIDPLDADPRFSSSASLTASSIDKRRTGSAPAAPGT